MSIALTKQLILEICRGKSLSDQVPAHKLNCLGLEFDSRQIKGGELFVALKAQAHGHQFLKQADAQNAALFLVEDEKPAANLSEPFRACLVQDSLQAFWDLAAWWRRTVNCRLAAITGSVGKTTVKEMCAHILMQVGAGVYSQKSYNNYTGVPYTLSKLKNNSCFAVVEIGMNHPGEISGLAKISSPDVAAVTTIAPAHIGNMGSLEGIAKEKFSILEGLKPAGALIYNADCEFSRAYLKAQGITESYQTFPSGLMAETPKFLSVKSNGLSGSLVEAELLGERINFQLKVPSAQAAVNATCAALIAKTMFPALQAEDIRRRLESFSAPLSRLQIYEVENRKVIDDSYNANPASMRSALTLMAEEKLKGVKIALVLGDMLELGAFELQYHKELAGQVAALHPAALVYVGANCELFKSMAGQNGINALAFENSGEENLGLISEWLERAEWDVLLVKASEV